MKTLQWHIHIACLVINNNSGCLGRNISKDSNFEISLLSYLTCPDFEVSLQSIDLGFLISNLVTQSPTDYLHTISIAFPNRNASKVHSNSSLCLIATEAGSSASPVPLVLSGTTAASRAARRTAPASAPAPRLPPAPTLSTLTARQHPSDSACARRRPSGRLYSRCRHASHHSSCFESSWQV
jgi:hypothetical protein